MARVRFRLPDVGEGIAEAEIVAWHVKVGDMVEEDQPLVDVMTDKATVEMAAPVSGRIVELAGEVGDQMPIGSALAVFETEGGEAAAEPAPATRRRAQGRSGAREGASPRPAKVEAPVGRQLRLLRPPAVRRRCWPRRRCASAPRISASISPMCSPPRAIG